MANIRWATAWIVTLALLPALAFGQVLSNNVFNIQYGAGGITSLRRTNDSYETEYITRGGVLGNVVIQYRKGAEPGWITAREIGAGPAAAPGSNTVNYIIGTLLPTLPQLSTASASVNGTNLIVAERRPVPARCGAGRSRWPRHLGGARRAWGRRSRSAERLHLAGRARQHSMGAIHLPECARGIHGSGLLGIGRHAESRGARSGFLASALPGWFELERSQGHDILRRGAEPVQPGRFRAGQDHRAAGGSQDGPGRRSGDQRMARRSGAHRRRHERYQGRGVLQAQRRLSGLDADDRQPDRAAARNRRPGPALEHGRRHAGRPRTDLHPEAHPPQLHRGQRLLGLLAARQRRGALPGDGAPGRHQDRIFRQRRGRRRRRRPGRRPGRRLHALHPLGGVERRVRLPQAKKPAASSRGGCRSPA